MDALREQLEEEQEGRSDCNRQLSKAQNEVAAWRSKFEQEGTARADELEEARRKLQNKLSDAENAAEASMLKVQALEKAKSRLTGELEDLMIDVERVSIEIWYMILRCKREKKIYSKNHQLIIIIPSLYQCQRICYLLES